MKPTLYHWIGYVATVLLLALLAGFITLTIHGNSTTNILNATGSQRMRMERLAKDVLLLENVKASPARAQAVSELQNTLPVWEETQDGLAYGDSTLGLPTQIPSTVAYQVLLANADYVPMRKALAAIAAHLDAPDPVQVQVVLIHEYPYFLTMSQVNALWSQEIDDQTTQVSWIKFALLTLILLVVSVDFYIVHKKR